MLSSWKEIAHFFGKGVRTVQRWEKTLDLPIHRPPGAPSNVVLARTSDLEEWMHRGPVARSMQETQDTLSQSALGELARLEREVNYLAEISGASISGIDASRPIEERLSTLADAVGTAASHLSGDRRSARAA